MSLGHASSSISRACSRIFVESRATSRRSAAHIKYQPLQSKVPLSVITTSLALVGTVAYLYGTDTRSSTHSWLTVPLIRALYPDAEDAHEVGTTALKKLYALGLHPRERGDPDGAGDLAVQVFGTILANPLGISAGLDKHGDIPDALFALGPSIIEIGGITPRPQEGNPKPRVFRLPSQEGIINRYGLNSDGAEAVAAKLQNRVRQYAAQRGFGDHKAAEQRVLDGHADVPPGSLTSGKLLAVQVAKQETTPDNDINAIRDDYVFGTKNLARYADIIVVNVSCPNATGYRELQAVEPLTKILTGVVAAAQDVDRATKPRVMVKVSPDENMEEQVKSICQAIWKSGVDGVIVGNTTKRRPIEPLPYTHLDLKERSVIEERGGYSGPQLFKGTVDLVGKYRRLLDKTGREGVSQDSDAENKTQHGSAANEQKVIFCTGGIRTGEDALAVLNAGASVAQIYTAMVYGGAGHISKMKREMRERFAVKDDRPRA